jgi:putative ABC transport system permease protein
VAAEIALAAVLLVAAGLLVNSFMRLLNRDLNFEPDGLASFKYVVARGDFATQVGFDGLLPVFELTTLPAEAIARVHERLRAVPGIEAVGGMTYQPVNSFIIPRFPAWPVEAETDVGRRPDPRIVAGFLVTPDFFRTMRTPVLRGREVIDADSRASPPVVVINRAAERLFFPGRSALGRRIVVELAAGAPAREVVGVVADVPIRRKVLEPEPVIYLPSRQMPAVFRGGGPNFFGEMTFVLRHSVDAGAVLAAARQAVAEVDPARPIVDVGVVTRALNARLPELGNYVGAVGGFGAIALLLAAIGVYGVMAFAVAARTRELGIRRALGAGAGEVAVVIGRRAVVLIGIGLAGGLAIAAGLTGFIESQLIGVAPTDPATFAAAAMLLAGVALLACVPPTRRAIAVDPAYVLRSE